MWTWPNFIWYFLRLPWSVHKNKQHKHLHELFKLLQAMENANMNALKEVYFLRLGSIHKQMFWCTFRKRRTEHEVGLVSEVVDWANWDFVLKDFLSSYNCNSTLLSTLKGVQASTPGRIFLSSKSVWKVVGLKVGLTKQHILIWQFVAKSYFSFFLHFPANVQQQEWSLQNLLRQLSYVRLASAKDHGVGWNKCVC